MSESIQEETTRRVLTAAINAQPGTREYLEEREDQVWDTDELRRDFDVVGFAAPFVVVRRKADGIKGSLTFQHRPRFYYHFTPA